MDFFPFQSINLNFSFCIKSWVFKLILFNIFGCVERRRKLDLHLVDVKGFFKGGRKRKKQNKTHENTRTCMNES